MQYHQPDDVPYYTFNLLEDASVPHAIFTRQGGVSPKPWESLNVGGLVGDDPVRVLENRQRSFGAVARERETMYDVWQVHGNDVVCATRPRPLDKPHLKADVILTDRPDVTLFMRFADCVPIVLFDPIRGVAGLAHAGWQGTVKRTAAAAVTAMQAEYGCQAGDILAGIGPSIGVHHYEVGPEVALQVRNEFGSDADTLLVMPNADHGHVQFDLCAANEVNIEALWCPPG